MPLNEDKSEGEKYVFKVLPLVIATEGFADEVTERTLMTGRAC